MAAIVATGLAAANLAALVFGYDPDEPDKTAATLMGAIVLGLVAWGMWRGRYWAVLGMQAILAIGIILSAVALTTAANLAAVALVLAIIAPAGTLFWFLVKAMARIQMPERPSPRS